ncbi:MAG TPA: hypothetical protein VLH38_01635 [Patescibacteria group bacterium]|nr:hypothetical protein [Patescibacteria group bacterium]
MHSVVAALDGPTKTGKTRFAKEVEAAAKASGRIARANHGRQLETPSFNEIKTISAGNMFRAAAYLIKLEEERNRIKTKFVDGDTDRLREILQTEGIYHTLQTDPEVGRRVSPAAKLPGVQKLCGSLFCDAIVEAYNKDGALVLADARNPCGIMDRNNILGDPIAPASIIPIHSSTPANIAAQRQAGDYKTWFDEITERREIDKSRPEYPVHPPSHLIADLAVWSAQFEDITPETGLVVAYDFDNGENTSPEALKSFAEHVAALALGVGSRLDQLNAMA